MEHNVRANRAFLYEITTIVPTFKVHNVKSDSDQSEYSAFIINVLEKLPNRSSLNGKTRK